MIAHVRGKIEEKIEGEVIVDVAGVGYEVAVSALDYEACELGEERKLYTYHVVRENEERLYGFSSLMAKRMFEMLITVQGIGPKAAMAILSLAEPEKVRNAIANTDAGFIAKAAGVGKKSAERVIVDLRDKVGAPSYYGGAEVSDVVKGGAGAEPDEALDALMALGFSLKEATIALEKVDSDLTVEERVRLALRG